MNVVQVVKVIGAGRLEHSSPQLDTEGLAKEVGQHLPILH